ncbi:MAG TPA: YigZ family protein [Victivallales bacterium]|nr:YigZ family protein [Victivallales bacterium]
MNIISSPSSVEYIEKKSKFISSIFYVDTESKAKAYIRSVSDRYVDAGHNVYAYKILEDGVLKAKFSDDGEPKNTAGKPVYELLNRLELFNIVVIITRYFGGIKLGASGLIRAYMKSAKLGIEESGIINYIETKVYTLVFDYKIIGIVENIIENSKSTVLINKEFDKKVKFNISATEKDISIFGKYRDIEIFNR